jgi:hypothetical protein
VKLYKFNHGHDNLDDLVLVSFGFQTMQLLVMFKQNEHKYRMDYGRYLKESILKMIIKDEIYHSIDVNLQAQSNCL